MKIKCNNVIEHIDPEFSVENFGNWNLKAGYLKPVYSKPLLIMKINDDTTLTWRHSEALSLLDGLIKADIDSIKMIIDPDQDTGVVKNYECSFLEKIKQKIKSYQEEENIFKMKGGAEMATIKEEALAEMPKLQIKNIADLDSVSTDLELATYEGKDSDGNDFAYKFFTLNGQNYRVPGIVIGHLKEILEDRPDLKRFKVRKSGEGKGTRYTVIPLE